MISISYLNYTYNLVVSCWSLISHRFRKEVFIRPFLTHFSLFIALISGAGLRWWWFGFWSKCFSVFVRYFFRVHVLAFLCRAVARRRICSVFIASTHRPSTIRQGNISFASEIIERTLSSFYAHAAATADATAVDIDAYTLRARFSSCFRASRCASARPTSDEWHNLLIHFRAPAKLARGSGVCFFHSLMYFFHPPGEWFCPIFVIHHFLANDNFLI